MSIALESSNRIEGPGFIRGMSFISIFESPDPGISMAGISPGDQRFPAGNLVTKVVEEREQELGSCSSSIGRNSDFSGRSSMASDGEDETEVQSSYKGPLDTMDALEEVLPIRRGISKFYRGKSKSFTSLADASISPSIKNLAKPENVYTKKRKNLLACSIWDKNRSFNLRSNGGGISKRPTNSSRSTSALAFAMGSSESINTSENSNSNSPSSSPTQLLPPLQAQAKPSFNNASSSPPRRNFSSWRSFSMMDLQRAAATTTSRTSLSISGKDEHDKPINT